MGSSINNKQSEEIKTTLKLSPNTPLWQRVPTKDESGKYLGDFMMIIPKLKSLSADQQSQILNKLNAVLHRYQDSVVFADLNLKMNLLWVSVKPVNGIILELSSAIIESVPEAKLISDRPPASR